MEEVLADGERSDNAKVVVDKRGDRCRTGQVNLSPGKNRDSAAAFFPRFLRFFKRPRVPRFSRVF